MPGMSLVCRRKPMVTGSTPLGGARSGSAAMSRDPHCNRPAGETAGCRPNGLVRRRVCLGIRHGHVEERSITLIAEMGVSVLYHDFEFGHVDVLRRSLSGRLYVSLQSGVADYP